MIKNQETNLKDQKKEILFYYESRQNPNGDPGFENQPRLMPDGTIIVTDVRIKRTIRDFAKSKYDKPLFVDLGENGKPVMADDRAEEIIGSLEDDTIKSLILKTFDVPLFGALVTIRKGKDKKGKDKDSGSQKLTGPVQFGIGRSVNQVQILNPQITSRFVGKEKKKQSPSDDQEPDQHGTIGKFYAVDYALIKIQGAVNPANLGQYIEDEDVVQSFKEAESKLVSSLWEGTNALITRSKFPQRSIFLLEVTYDSSIYNDLPILVEDDPALKGRVNGLTSSPLRFTKLVEALKNRKNKVKKVKLLCCRELLKDTQQLKADVEALGIPVELVKTEEPAFKEEKAN